MGLLLEAIDVQDNLFVEPGNLIGPAVPDLWVVAIPGRVGGFMASGACGRSGGGLVGAGLSGDSDDRVVGREAPILDIGLGGSGLVGGSVGFGPGLVASSLNGAGRWGGSFDGGSTEIAVGEPPPFPLMVSSFPRDRASSAVSSFSEFMFGPANGL